MSLCPQSGAYIPAATGQSGASCFSEWQPVFAPSRCAGNDVCREGLRGLVSQSPRSRSQVKPCDFCVRRGDVFSIGSEDGQKCPFILRIDTLNRKLLENQWEKV